MYVTPGCEKCPPPAGPAHRCPCLKHMRSPSTSLDCPPPLPVLHTVAPVRLKIWPGSTSVNPVRPSLAGFGKKIHRLRPPLEDSGQIRLVPTKVFGRFRLTLRKSSEIWSKPSARVGRHRPKFTRNRPSPLVLHHVAPLPEPPVLPSGQIWRVSTVRPSSTKFVRLRLNFRRSRPTLADFGQIWQTSAKLGVCRSLEDVDQISQSHPKLGRNRSNLPEVC